MGRRKKVDHEENFRKLHPDWVVSDKMQINGRHVIAGTELSISGERGRFKFLKHVQTSTAEWIDVIGGPNNYRSMRSFRPDRVRRVHWKNKMRDSKKED